MSKIPFTFVSESNNTCDFPIGPNESDREADQYLNSVNGYIFTTEPLKKYYKPKDVFVCCYESPTYGEIYTDGYGLNFYTFEYGYYEYDSCGEYYENVGAMAGAIAWAIISGALVCCCVIMYCCCKKCCAKEREPERSEAYKAENPPPEVRTETVVTTGVVN